MWLQHASAWPELQPYTTGLSSSLASIPELGAGQAADRGWSGAAQDVPPVTNAAAADRGGPTDMELEEEAAVGTGVDAGLAPMAGVTDGPQANAKAPDPAGGGG